MIIPDVSRTCVSLTAGLSAAESHDGTTADQSVQRKMGKEWFLKRLVYSLMKPGQVGGSLNAEEEMKLKYQGSPALVSILSIFGSTCPLLDDTK